MLYTERHINMYVKPPTYMYSVCKATYIHVQCIIEDVCSLAHTCISSNRVVGIDTLSVMHATSTGDVCPILYVTNERIHSA